MNHGVIRYINTILKETSRPMKSKDIAAIVQQRFRGAAPFDIHKNVPSILAQEMSKRYPRWKRVGRGIYASNKPAR